MLATLLLGGGCAPPPRPTHPEPPAATSTAPATTPPSPEATSSPAETPTAKPTTTPTPSKPAARGQLRVYFVRGETIGVGTARYAPMTSPARAAMTELLAGPTSAEKKLGLSTQIPKGTKLRGLAISKGTATVDLSKRFESGGGTLSMGLRIAEVVATLTQFKSVERVRFKLDGKTVESIGGEGIIVSPSVDRSDLESALPPILLEAPLPKQKIASPVRIAGTANVFEARFRARIEDADGTVLADKPVTAASGTGTRGAFDSRVKFVKPTHANGALVVYERSAKDGSEINVVRIPVMF